MTAHRLSQRETWMLAILPGGLVLLISFALPSNKQEAARLQTQVKSAPKQAQYNRQMRDLTTQLNTFRRDLSELEQRKSAIDSALAKMEALPTEVQTQPLAECFQLLSQRLASEGVMIVATEAEAPNTQRGRKDLWRWRLTLAGTWEQVRLAISDEQLVPDRLLISSLEMHKPDTASKLRRWTLTVKERRTS